MVRINGRGADIQGKQVFHFIGLPESPLQNMYLQDVFFAHDMQDVTWNCSHVVNSTVRSASVSPWPPCSSFRIVDEESSESFSVLLFRVNVALALVMMIGLLLWTRKPRLALVTYD